MGDHVGVVDLRSISPLDVATLRKVAAESHRIVVVHEAPTLLDIRAEITASIAQECFYDLEAPVLRVGSYNLPYPPAHMEIDFLPDVDRVLDAADASLKF